jgi:hypothetical protein
LAFKIEVDMGPRKSKNDKLCDSLSLLALAVELYNALLPTISKVPPEVMVIILIGVFLWRSL